MVSICLAMVLHVVSAAQENRPIIRFGPATITALFLMFFSFLSLKFGTLQTNTGWNSDIDLIYKNCAALILMEAMATTMKRVWAMQATLLFATLWWVKGGIRLSGAGATYSGDRLMGPAVSLIENPNGYAYMMAVMIPLYLFFYQQDQNRWRKMGFLFLVLASIYIILQTGSRTGLLAMMAAGIFLLPKYGAKHKKVLALAAVVIFFFAGSLGELNVQRFKSIPDSFKAYFSGNIEEKDPSMMNQDEQSAWERKMKNKHTWKLIRDNILFGVGIQSNDALVTEKYEYAGGQVHCEILYAGKQMGLIGMTLYSSFMLTLLLSAIKIQNFTKGWWPAASDMGWTFKMQCIVFIVGGYFSPIPWNPIYLVITASASAAVLNLRRDYPVKPVAT